MAFIHRFGSSLNAHLHFHCVVIDGVFEPAPADGVVDRARCQRHRHRAGRRAPGATTAPRAPIAVPAAEPAHRRAARYAWATLLARIYEVFPLLCPHCRAAMRIAAFITDGPTVRDLLSHLGEPAAPPRSAPARGPPRWEAADAEHEPTADTLLPPIAAFEFDQRITW